MIMAVAAIAGGATYAAYHKEGSVLGATFSNSDNMALKIDQNPSGAVYDWVDSFSVPSNYYITNVRPGSHGEQILDIKNVGNVPGKATIKMTAQADTALYEDMNFAVSFSPNHDNNFVNVWSGPLTAWNGNAVDLGAITSTATTDGLSGSQFSGQTASVKIDWSVPIEAGNEIMGSSVVIDTVFGLDSILPTP